MTSSVVGRLFDTGDFNVTDWQHRNTNAISSAGTNRCFDTSDFSGVTNGDWQRYAPAVNGAYVVNIALTAGPLSGPWLRPFPHNGVYKVGGISKSGGVAYPCWVYLFAAGAFAQPLAAKYTDPDGVFLFDYLAAGTYAVIAVDVTVGSGATAYDIIGCDFVVAVAM